MRFSDTTESFSIEIDGDHLCNWHVCFDTLFQGQQSRTRPWKLKRCTKDSALWMLSSCKRINSSLNCNSMSFQGDRSDALKTNPQSSQSSQPVHFRMQQIQQTWRSGSLSATARKCIIHVRYVARDESTEPLAHSSHSHLFGSFAKCCMSWKVFGLGPNLLLAASQD